jgi:hypothetical protein
MGLSDVFQSIQSKLSFSKSVEISGIKFELRLLSFDQEIKAEAAPSPDTEPMAFFNESKLQTLSFAVKSIDGETVPDIVETKKGDITEKMQGSLFVKGFLSSLPSKVIDQLFDTYVDMKDQADTDLDKSFKYEWFKTPEQREEDARKRRTNAEEETTKKEETSEEKEIKFTEIKEPPEDDKKPV